MDVQLILRIKDIRILDFLSGSFSFVVDVYSGYTIDNVVGCNLLYDIDNITEIKKRVKTLNIWLKCIWSSWFLIDVYSRSEDLYHLRIIAIKRILLDYKLMEIL